MGHHNHIIRWPLLHFSTTEAEPSEAPVLRVRRPRKLRSEFLGDNSFPIDKNGALALPQQVDRPMVSQFLQHRHVEHEHLVEFLNDKFLKVIDAILKQDEA